MTLPNCTFHCMHWRFEDNADVCCLCGHVERIEHDVLGAVVSAMREVLEKRGEFIPDTTTLSMMASAGLDVVYRHMVDELKNISTYSYNLDGGRSVEHRAGADT